MSPPHIPHSKSRGSTAVLAGIGGLHWLQETHGRSDACCLDPLLQGGLKNVCLHSEVFIYLFIYLFIYVPKFSQVGQLIVWPQSHLIWLFSCFCSIFIFSLVVVFTLNSEKPFLLHTKTVWSSMLYLPEFVYECYDFVSCCLSNRRCLWHFSVFQPLRVGTNHVKCFPDVSMNLR